MWYGGLLALPLDSKKPSIIKLDLIAGTPEQFFICFSGTVAYQYTNQIINDIRL